MRGHGCLDYKELPLALPLCKQNLWLCIPIIYLNVNHANASSPTPREVKYEHEVDTGNLRHCCMHLWHNVPVTCRMAIKQWSNS